MPPDPKQVKSDRRRPTKVDTSKKTGTTVNKLVKQSSSRETVKNEKFRSGSIDRTAVGRTQDNSQSRQARSVDRAPKELQKAAAGSKEKSKNSVRKNSVEIKPKLLDKKSEGQKSVVPSPRYKSTSHERNNVGRSKASIPKKEHKVSDPKKPSSNLSSKKLSSSSTNVKSSDKRREHIDDRKHKSSSSQKSSVNEDKTASFVTVLPEEESPPVRPGTSTIRKGRAAVTNGSENIPEPSPENQENRKKSAKVSHTTAPSASDDNNAEEEYNYEDDFEDYDSDFEEESDTDSVSDTESSKSDDVENEEKEASEPETNVVPSKDEESTAGLFLHPTIVKRAPPSNKPASKTGNKGPRQVLRMSERIRNYEETPKEEPPPVSGNMKTSRSFINFAGAKEERQKKKVTNKILKRGMELLEIITLDKVSYDVFDMPPMKYDVYIRSFGKSNTKQAFIQTENTEDEEVETDEIEVREKWTQHPPNDHLGVGGDLDLVVERSDTDWQSHFKTDAVKLNNFVQNVAPVVLALLAEDLPHLSLRQITERRPDVFFSQGYYNLTPLPFCKGAPVIHLCCSPVSENYLISVHGNMCTFPSTEVPVEEKGVICIWNLYDISRPEFVLISNSQPACSCFGPGNSSTIVAGMVDGSVMLWDLTEPSSGHYQYQHGTSEIVLRSPTYNTAAVVGEDKHHGCVVSIQAARYSNGQANPLKDGVNDKDYKSCLIVLLSHLLQNPQLTEDVAEIVCKSPFHSVREQSSPDKGSAKTFHVLSLEDMGVLNVWVVIEVLKLDPSGSESDLGLSPGGKLRLIRSSTILLHSLNVLSPDLLAGIRTFEFRMLPSDLNHVLVTTDAGIVLHVTRHSGNAFPKYFSYDADLSTEIRSIDCSPHNDSLFLVGCSDGSVRLHSIKSARPVMIWPQAAGGEPVLLVQWSTNQPAVFYVLDTVSHMYVWDLRKNTTKPTQTCHFDGPRVTWFALNGRNEHQTDSSCPSMMAVAKENGKIEVHALKQQIDVINEVEYNRQIQFMQSL